MKKVLLTLTIAIITFNLQAQNCNQGEELARRTWEKWGPWEPKLHIVPYKATIRTVKFAWNIIASHSPANLSPRFLEFNEVKEQGNIVPRTKRTFVTPPPYVDNVEITINKFDGKARTGVVICTQGKDGITQNIANYTFPRDKRGKIKKFRLNNVKGKIIIVAMKNLSAGNKFKYRISAKAL